MWIVEFNTKAGLRIFFEPNMSHITKVSRKQPRTEDFFLGCCDQAIKATRPWAPWRTSGSEWLGIFGKFDFAERL